MSVDSPLSVRKLKILPEKHPIEAIAWIDIDSDDLDENINDEKYSEINKIKIFSESDKFLPNTCEVNKPKIKKEYDADGQINRDKKKSNKLGYYFSTVLKCIPWKVPWMIIVISGIQVGVSLK